MVGALLNPTYLKALCTQYGLMPSKAYGQHYLISDAPIRKMIEAGKLSSSDIVIEVGPGFGVLTLAVAPLAKQVIAFEIEQKLKPYWDEKIKEYPNIEIVWGNFLHQFKAVSRQPYKILANLPYQITSDALRVMLEADPAPEQIVIMVQKEVAERITARPGSMSLLSASVQYYGRPSIVAHVPRGSFWPPPKVDSAVIALTLTARSPGASSEQFFRFVKAGFSHKRKQLWRNLSAGLHLDEDTIKDALRRIVGSERVRAEELSIEEWHKLARSV